MSAILNCGVWICELSYSLAELAGDTSLFTRGVSSESVLATESGRDRALGWVSYMVGYVCMIEFRKPSRRGSR
jgi:hypothetical protein